MNKILIILALIAVAIAAYSMSNWTTESNQSLKASSTITTDIRTVDDFDKMSVSGAISVEVTYGSEESIEVEAPKNYHNFVQTKVKSGRLILKMKSGRNYTEGVKIRIKTAKLNEFEISGASSVHLNNSLKDDHLTVHSSGAANFSGDLNIKEADIELDGASSMIVSGKAQTANIELSGACQLKDYTFEVKTLHINLSGASRMQISGVNSIEGNVSGASTLDYKGTNVVKKIKIGGASNVTKH